MGQAWDILKSCYNPLKGEIRAEGDKEKALWEAVGRLEKEHEEMKQLLIQAAKIMAAEGLAAMKQFVKENNIKMPEELEDDKA